MNTIDDYNLSSDEENENNSCNIYNGLYEKLSQFQKCQIKFRPDNYEKVKFIKKSLNEHKLMPKIPLRMPKTNKDSLKYRKIGNEYFTKFQNYNGALKSYNKCIAFAQMNTKYLSIGYAKRSAVFFHLKCYTECLRDIELTFKSKCYPNKFIEKLEKCREICLTAIINQFKLSSISIVDYERDQYDIELLTKLSYPSNSKIPFLSNCLEMKNSSKYGRSIITNCNLKSGDIVAIEKPFAAILTPKLRYQFCSNCLQESYSLIPCPTCTSAMFCTEKCLKIAQVKYHKLECPIIDYLYEVFDNIQLTAIRVMFQVMSLFKNIDQLIEFEGMTRNFDTNIFTIDFTAVQYDDDYNVIDDDNDSVLNVIKKNYYPIHALSRNVLKWNPSDCLYFTVQTVIFNGLLTEHHTILKESIQTKEQKNFLINFIHAQFEVAAMYYHALVACLPNPQDPYESIPLTYGTAAYPFSGLLNHSCAPNTLRVYNGSIATIIILKPIKKGEQLFDGYCGTHHIIEKNERRRTLKFKYHFQCECLACLADYPLKNALKIIPVIPNITEKDEILPDNLRDVIKVIQKYYDFLNKFSPKYYPCDQVFKVEQLLRIYMSMAFKMIRLRYENDTSVFLSKFYGA